ncbi:hypothetical protein ACFE04_028167 [Oxalis oulophora]
MNVFPFTSPGKWARISASALHTALSFIVFLFFDFIEIFLCVIYRYLDLLFEGKISPCYCQSKGETSGGELLSESETLYGRRNVFRQLVFFRFARKFQDCDKKTGNDEKTTELVRWSDCGCESCVEWIHGDHKLHVVVRQPSGSEIADEDSNRTENVIFLHGFLCSSSLWTETIFKNLSEPASQRYRLFAVDLLGFGKSPKPRDCLYTLKDHVEMIEKSVVFAHQLKSFHVVAHSMGCIVALALAAKYSKHVKSVTLVAPPYFPSKKDGASLVAFETLAKRRLWPPLLFGAAFMSWYEHLGRCVCLVVCKGHRVWEMTIKLLSGSREVHFMLRDLARHTHSSAWHSTHNVIYGGAKFTDEYLETLSKSKTKICVMQGDLDNVVPLKCSRDIKKLAPDAEINIVENTNHTNVILGRENEFTRDLEHIWSSVNLD